MQMELGMDPVKDFTKTSVAHSGQEDIGRYNRFHDGLSTAIDEAKKAPNFYAVTKFADHARRFTRDMLNFYERNVDPRFPLTADELARGTIHDIAEIREAADHRRNWNQYFGEASAEQLPTSYADYKPDHLDYCIQCIDTALQKVHERSAAPVVENAAELTTPPETA